MNTKAFAEFGCMLNELSVDYNLTQKEIEMTLTRTVLDCWVNGNYSLLDKSELIAIARYFETKAKGEEVEIIEDEIEEVF